MRSLVGASIMVALLAMVGVPAHAADVEAGKRKAEVCVACHGADGNATVPGTPSLAGQPVYFTHWQLIKYRDGRRKDPQMSPFAKNLSDVDMADLAAYYASQRPVARPATTDPVKVAEGKRLATLHHCSSCHRPDLSGPRRFAGDQFRRTSHTRRDLDGPQLCGRPRWRRGPRGGPGHSGLWPRAGCGRRPSRRP
jgi:cytochrome c553